MYNIKIYTKLGKIIYFNVDKEMSSLNKRNQTCCFTGHRKIAKAEYKTVKERVQKVIEELLKKGVIYYVNGMAAGFDLITASIVLEMKQQYPKLQLILVLPCKNQTDKWRNSADIALYESIIKKADKVVCIAEQYYDGCMQARNKHLVNNSSYCICYKRYEAGGTYQTVKYAKENGLVIYNVAE